MKLKERPLEWWKGRKYTYWCRADSNDERRILYTLNKYSIGQGHEVFHYDSNVPVDGYVMYCIRNSFIHEIKLINDEWHIELDYPFYMAD